MDSFLELLALATAMGLAIFLSMPLVLRKSRSDRLLNLLSGAAVGILVFVLADVWGNVAALLYLPNSFLTNVSLDALFLVAALGAFLLLYFLEHRSGAAREISPTTTALVVALAIGFQNLTEGMVFGSAWAAGTLGLLAVIFAGFFLQNVTEGFPIAVPLLRAKERRVAQFSSYFLLGGIPATLGAGVGFFWTSTPLIVGADALAIGTCLYAILPMLKASFRPAESPEATRLKQSLTYLGIGLGFAVGFLVNAF